jgi:hypothetical protein
MLHLDPGVPNCAKRVTQQRLMHQWLTRSRRDAPGRALEVLLPADSMFSLFAQPVIVAIKIYEIKSVCLHVGSESLNRT